MQRTFTVNIGIAALMTLLIVTLTLMVANYAIRGEALRAILSIYTLALFVLLISYKAIKRADSYTAAERRRDNKGRFVKGA